MPQEQLNLVQATAGHSKKGWLKAPGLAAELVETYVVPIGGLITPLCSSCTDVLSYKPPASTAKMLKIEDTTAYRSDK